MELIEAIMIACENPEHGIVTGEPKASEAASLLRAHAYNSSSHLMKEALEQLASRINPVLKPNVKPFQLRIKIEGLTSEIWTGLAAEHGRDAIEKAVKMLEAIAFKSASLYVGGAGEFGSFCDFSPGQIEVFQDEHSRAYELANES